MNKVLDKHLTVVNHPIWIANVGLNFNVTKIRMGFFTNKTQSKIRGKWGIDVGFPISPN